MKKHTTIVVPVYGDWPSLKQCIESLVKHVALDNMIMLVNDCGPDVEMMEKNILKSIKGHKHFVYHRNPKNLGFVGTCNRAALELDTSGNDILLLNSDTIVTEGFLEEMREVLYTTYKHGAVFPRSNNATIGSVPFLFNDGDQTRDRDVDYTKKVYADVKNLLPRYTVTPIAHGFCIMIKRFLIDDHKLFDPVYGLGYNEENDFSMRINQYGFSCVMANKAMVYHLESKSFTSEKKKLLNERNHRTLINRYPHYDAIIQRYLAYEMDPVDRFSDVISTHASGPKRLMIDLFHLPLAMNGTARNCISFIEMLTKHPLITSGKVLPIIVTSPEASQFYNLDRFNLDILAPHEVNQLFHLAVCPLQIFHSDNLQMLNRWALRVVFAHLDIIAIRTRHLLDGSPLNEVIFEDAFRLADRVIAISEFTKEDTKAYYWRIDDIIERKTKVILQGYPDVNFGISEKDLDVSRNDAIKDFMNAGEYILVFGNDFKHKMVYETMKKLVNSSKRFIVLGPRRLPVSGDNILLVESGGLSDETIWGLYEHAQFVVFPSVYEGFGLPIAEAAKFGKSIVVSNYGLNREVEQLYKGHTNVRFVDTIQEIFDVVEGAEAKNLKMTSSSKAPFRTITDYNTELIDSALELLDEPVDAQALRDRWSYFTRLDRYMIEAGGGTFRRYSKSVVERSAHFLKNRNKRVYYLARNVYRSTIKKKK